MLYEKRRITIHRSVWLGLLLLGIIIPIIISYAPAARGVELVDDNGYINDYYEYSNRTSCEIEVVFNVKVDSGYITVAFYDSNDKLLAEKEGYFYGYDKELSSTFYIDGKVDSYEIISYDISASSGMPSYAIQIIIYIDIFIFAFFIAALFLSYKVYDYNGNEIVVYAGWYHHYIKVNGIKVDEHDTFISYTAIVLSCTLDDCTNIQATITKSNRITLKINNQLYTRYKKEI